MPGTEPEPGVAASAAPLANEILWQAAVGKRSDYYLPRFAKYEREKRSFPSWHWPALFIAFWWALYRKAWAGAALFFFLPILVSLPPQIGVALLAPEDKHAGSLAYWASVVVAWMLPPMLANGIYFRRVKAWVEEAQTRYPDSTAQVAYLAGKGGTSGGVAVAAAAFVFLAVVGILASIALPAYQDYATRARVSGALAAVEPLKQQVEIQWSDNGTVPDELDLRPAQAEPGAADIKDIRFNNDTGVITIVFATTDDRLNGKSVEWVPSTAPDQRLRWRCRAIDLPTPVLPELCRH